MSKVHSMLKTMDWFFKSFDRTPDTVIAIVKL